MNNILKKKREYDNLVDPLMYPCIVNIVFGPMTVQYREVLQYLYTFKKYLLHSIEFKVRPGSGFYQFPCILGHMSCLCIHLVTLFKLPCKKMS